MMMFWIATLALVVLSSVFILWPLLVKKEVDDEARRDELNKAFYKDRLAELEEETDEGLVDNQQELVSDLKQTLLDDIPNQQKSAETQVSMPLVVGASIVFMAILSYGTYFKYGASDDVVSWQQVSNNLPELTKKLMSPGNEPLADDEMDDLTLALRTRLHHQPEDSTGWLLLGRIALANRDITTAIGSMKKAYRLEPQDTDIQLGYAQALMLSSDESDLNNARAILSGLIKEDYVDLRVFSLLAFDAFEQQDYPAAVQYWSMMQKMIGPEDSRYTMLQRSIENARLKMGDAQQASGKSVAITISLSPEVQANSNAALIVSAHRADGSPMPVAAARYPLGSFPRTVVIDDRNSMIEGQNLSDLPDFMIRARIDSDGNVSTREGDWYGESSVIKLGEQVALTIDKRY
ncbi:c-type cytochrome biogenesis protein CcmI [Vibrio tapetis subsp. quintayensis]|uniref:c-type cytochrome biogenesis protein CcmI n=1 Tax=Vibrio tapetis TaxID=52443 RepID=UPI0025B3951F|nr:c-type cytochrome biogenesis protein CcmI [Vibrio tapetis]MDN3682611.1 c-type cytochrome biogenesis protein CcmI [Vibrio tapetis subsp. quintayensis]